MFNYVANLLALPSIKNAFVQGLKQQRTFMQQTIDIDLQDIQKNIDDSLSEKDFKKINDYYGYAVPAILGEAFCLLRGQAMTTRERHAMTYLGALTGLFDDFFDEKKTSKEHIKLLLDAPDESNAMNAHQRLIIRLFRHALAHLDEPEVLKSYCYQVYDAQIWSSKQSEITPLTQEELQQITCVKGGLSFLYYRTALGPCHDKIEEQMLYNFGSISQLENDMFDVYKDIQNGVQTLATTSTKIDELRIYYTKLTQDTFELAHQTNYRKANQQKFLRFAALIIARGYVCLDVLEQAARKSNGIFSPSTYQRSDLICDMEKTTNRLKLLHYYAKTSI
jgi:hypothetical protein